MKVFSIRSRVMLAALLPVTLASILLSMVFLVWRVGSVAEEHLQRIQSLARQLASASEYGMFSANTESLQALATTALHEPDVHAVMMLGAQGQVLAKAGQPEDHQLPALDGKESLLRDSTTERDVLLQPVLATRQVLDDIFEPEKKAQAHAPEILGYVFLSVSRASLLSRERNMLAAGVIITLGGLLFGCLLAIHIAQGVLRPIARVSDMVKRISQGDLSTRGEVLADDPLRELQHGLNLMAERLAQGRDELEQRVTQVTRELREKKEEAESATRAKSRFLAAASHDLRQPTHAMGLFVAQLAQLPLNEKATQLVTHLNATVLALQSMLNALLDISKLDAQAVQVHAGSFPIQSLLDQIRDNLQPMAQEKNLRLRIRPSSAWVTSDADLLLRILINLVTNALCYTRDGGVLVACRSIRGGRRLRIEVWDSGIGIAPEHQQDIFKEFFQVGNPQRDRTMGLGLGLNIVERTAKLLRHPLSLRSRLGHGTRFSIEVPVASPQQAAALPISARPEPRLDLSGRKVLVVEDDGLVALALQGLLESWGCTVSVSDGLDTALVRLAEDGVPDIILSDYRLGGNVRGIETIRQLRLVAGRPIPACLLSGDTDPGLMRLVKQETDVVLLHKPVQAENLRSFIRTRLQYAPPDGGSVKP